MFKERKGLKTVVMAGLVAIFVVGLWYVAQRASNEDSNIFSPPSTRELYDPLGINPNSRSLSLEEIVQALELLGLNPSPQKLTEEEKQEKLEGLGVYQGQE